MSLNKSIEVPQTQRGMMKKQLVIRAKKLRKLWRAISTGFAKGYRTVRDKE